MRPSSRIEVLELFQGQTADGPVAVVNFQFYLPCDVVAAAVVVVAAAAALLKGSFIQSDFSMMPPPPPPRLLLGLAKIEGA